MIQTPGPLDQTNYLCKTLVELLHWPVHPTGCPIQSPNMCLGCTLRPPQANRQWRVPKTRLSNAELWRVRVCLPVPSNLQEQYRKRGRPVWVSMGQQSTGTLGGTPADSLLPWSDPPCSRNASLPPPPLFKATVNDQKLTEPTPNGVPRRRAAPRCKLGEDRENKLASAGRGLHCTTCLFTAGNVP